MRLVRRRALRHRQGRASTRFFFWLLLLETLVVAFAGPVFGIVLLGLVIGYAAFTRVPVEVLLPVFIFLVMALDNPANQPADGMWESPFLGLGGLLFENRKPLPFSLIDISIGFMALRSISAIIARANAGSRSGDVVGVPPRVFLRAAQISVFAILWHLVHGIYSGGDWKQGLYQTRTILWLPMLAIAVASITTLTTIRHIERAVLWGAVIKALTGMWFYMTVAKPDKLNPAYVGTHSDSVMYALVVAMLGARWFESRTRASRRRLMWALPFFFAAMTFNGRRIVYVGVAGAIAYLVAMTSREAKRKVMSLVLALSPLIVVYIGIGLKSNAKPFYPVKMINGVIFQDDRSSQTRDVENFNLFVTYIQNPILGPGAGHEYIEYIQGDDISKQFPQYRYLPHNSYLGLWAFAGGPVTMLYWLTVFVAVYCATSSLRRSRSPDIRAAAIWAVGGIISYLVQTYGDVGLFDWTPTIIAGLCCGIGGGLIPLVVAEEQLAEEQLAYGQSADDQERFLS